MALYDMIIPFNKSSHSRAINDNVHCQATWRFVYKWSEKERNKSNLPTERWNQQRLVHYLYEILNRPWLPDHKKIIQAKAWFRHERIFTPNITYNASLREIFDIASGRTQLIYDHEDMIENEAEKTGQSPYEAYIKLLHGLNPF